MSKEKFAAVKSKFKTCAPVAIAAASIATIATVAYFKSKTLLELPKDAVEALQSRDTDLRYSINGSDYALRYIGNTPSN